MISICLALSTECDDAEKAQWRQVQELRSFAELNQTHRVTERLVTVLQLASTCNQDKLGPHKQMHKRIHRLVQNIKYLAWARE